MFNPNAPLQQQPGQFDFEARQAAIEHRKRLLAQLMRQQEQAQATPGPQGQMVGGQYVKPHALEHLAHAAKPLMAQWGANREQRALEDDTAAYANADREAAQAHVASRPQARPGYGANEMDNDAVPASQPSTREMLQWAQRGASIPSRRDTVAKVMADLEVNEPIRQEAREDKKLDREDRQADRRATIAAQIDLRREQLAQAAEAAKQRSEDARASREDRAAAAREANAIRLQIAEMNADARRDAADARRTAGKALPQSALKDLGALEETADRIGSLKREFNPSYGGLKGAAATIAGNNIPGVTTEASEWWKNYRKEAELVERHAMFGASLTEGEKKAWRDADLSPSMAPEAIQRNLARREELARKVFANAVDRQQRAGYNVREAFDAPAPQRAGAGGGGGSWDAPTSIPKGWSVKTR